MIATTSESESCSIVSALQGLVGKLSGIDKFAQDFTDFCPADGYARQAQRALGGQPGRTHAGEKGWRGSAVIPGQAQSALNASTLAEIEEDCDRASLEFELYAF